MKTKTRRNRPASIAKTRWAAYAAASAATALAGGNSAEAAIHYSGILNVKFPKHTDTVRTFTLDQDGDSIYFARKEVIHFQTGDRTDVALFRVNGLLSAHFAGFFVDGFSNTYGLYVSKLHFGEKISEAHFFTISHLPGTLARNDFLPGSQQWGDHGTGYVGFRFNNGAGFQYGWARVRITGHPEDAFKVLDYAYGDPGEPIGAGQRSSEQTPDEGSLGWLAAGAVGLVAWRKSRSLTARSH